MQKRLVKSGLMYELSDKFLLKSKGKENSGVSVGIRGPVTIHQAVSIDTVDINSMQITKSVNSETTETGKKSSRHHGIKAYGSIRII